MSIHLKKPEEELYNILQQKSLDYVQQLSHAVWTDFNEHDPGVTILDLLNYVLWELDYQLSFDLEDYLNTKESAFNPEEHGLFSPGQVFPVSPVTSDDYRKLFFDLENDIEDVQVSIHTPEETDPYACKGLYDVKIQLSVWTDTSIRRSDIRKKIQECYARNRNLCESLNEITFVDWKKLEIRAEIQIEPHMDASVLLANIYMKGCEVFSEGMRYRQFDEAEKTDQIFDGPTLNHYMIDADSMHKTWSVSFMSKLYKKIREVPGVKAIYGLDLLPEDKWEDPYITIQFPQKPKDVKIVLKKENKEIPINFEVVSRLLYQYRINSRGNQYRISDLDSYYSAPAGKYRQIYDHYSVQHDFPNCYGINKWGIAPNESDQRKAQAHQLKAYLLLFDLIFAKGLKELKEFPVWMSLNNSFPADENPDLSTDSLLQWNELVDEAVRKQNEVVRNHTLWDEKSRWLDVLDRLYGENSNPSLLTNFNYYDDTNEFVLYRRTNFLKQIPVWGRDRFKGIQVNEVSEKGMSGIEKYIRSLLGFIGIPLHPVANLYASYNIEVLDDSTFFSKFSWLMDYRLIISESNRFMVTQLKEVKIDYISWPEQEYSWLREKVPFLRQGIIFETFLIGGFKKENFKQLYIPITKFHQLLFYYEPRQEWVSLGRFETEELLTKVAILLHSFLFMLNKKSETLYVVEHILLRPVKTSPERVVEEEDEEDEEEDYDNDLQGMSSIANNSNLVESDRLPLDFSLSIVFAAGSVLMSDPLFQKQLEILVQERLPVHLDADMMWLRPEEMVRFERLYYAWREALVSSEAERINLASTRLTLYLVELKNKRQDDYHT